METWIVKKIGAASWRRVVAWGVTLVAGLLLVTSDRRYIDNFLHGPYTLGAAELNAITDVTTTPHYFARVSGSRVIDTELREYSGAAAPMCRAWSRGDSCRGRRSSRAKCSTARR